MESSYQKEIHAITTTFLTLLPQLSDVGKAFILSRLYRVSGNIEYLRLLKDITLHQYTLSLQKYSDNHFSSKSITESLSSLYPLSEPVPKKDKRNRYIHTNSFVHDLILFKNVITDLEYLNRMNLLVHIDRDLYSQSQEYIETTYPKIIHSIKNNPESILYIPVQVVNSIYLAKFLPNSPVQLEHEGMLFEIIQAQYTKEVLQDPIVFLNYLYTLTHLVIGESQFYNTHISDDRFQWIWDTFITNQDKIFQTDEVDIIAEVGVCLSLHTEPFTDSIQDYQKAVVQYFEPQLGYIPSRFYANGSFEDLNFCKHRNILAVMLLSGMENLHQF